MDNAIRTALDTWAKLIKGLSFDERVGFLTATYIKNIHAQAPYKLSFDEISIIRDGIRRDLVQLQSEQLKALDNRRGLPTPSAQAKTQTVKVVKSHATREQLIAAIDKAVKRVGYGDKNAAKDIQRYAKQLERIENVNT